jgi:hypothetical protein
MSGRGSSSVYFRFKNEVNPSTISFDGPYISLNELKREIFAQKGSSATDTDLKITNAQTNEGDYLVSSLPWDSVQGLSVVAVFSSLLFVPGLCLLSNSSAAHLLFPAGAIVFLHGPCIMHSLRLLSPPEYTSGPATLIPKNTSVVVARMPLAANVASHPFAQRHE